MKYFYRTKLVIYILILLTCSACANLVSSAVESSIVLIVAHHDKVVEKKQKKYSATDKCFISGRPDIYNLAQQIAYGQPITQQYNRVLSRTGDDRYPVQPHQLAYAFLIMADRMGDIRAKQQMAWMERFMQKQDIDEIRSIVDDKYYLSHLDKCFFVPDEYRMVKTTRQMIMEEQARLENRYK